VNKGNIKARDIVRAHIGSSPEKFWKAFDFALAQKMSFSLAMLFCKKYNQKGETDASEGFCFYALNVMLRGLSERI